jgi:hypothetical protein
MRRYCRYQARARTISARQTDRGIQPKEKSTGRAELKSHVNQTCAPFNPLQSDFPLFASASRQPKQAPPRCTQTHNRTQISFLLLAAMSLELEITCITSPARRTSTTPRASYSKRYRTGGSPINPAGLTLLFAHCVGACAFLCSPSFAQTTCKEQWGSSSHTGRRS